MDQLQELELGAQRAQRLDQAHPDPATPVNGEAGRLVDDEQPRVLVQHGRRQPGRQAPGRRRRRCGRRGAHGRQPELLAPLEPVLRTHASTVDADLSLAQHAVDAALRDPPELTPQHVVDPLPRRGLGNAPAPGRRALGGTLHFCFRLSHLIHTARLIHGSGRRRERHGRFAGTLRTAPRRVAELAVATRAAPCLRYTNEADGSAAGARPSMNVSTCTASHTRRAGTFGNESLLTVVVTTAARQDSVRGGPRRCPRPAPALAGRREPDRRSAAPEGSLQSERMFVDHSLTTFAGSRTSGAHAPLAPRCPRGYR